LRLGFAVWFLCAHGFSAGESASTLGRNGSVAMSTEMEPIRKPSFILWMWAGLLLCMGCSWWWEYSHQGYIRVFTKDGHGGYLRYEGSLAIALFSVCLAVGALVLISCLRRLRR